MASEPAHLQIVDPRNADRHLRVSWHATNRVVVFSQWRDGVCVATTPVELAEIPGVIGVLVNALEEATTRPLTETETPATGPTAQSVRQDINELVRDWLRPHLASITALTPRSTNSPEEVEPPEEIEPPEPTEV
ncbi:MAG TPA: hypothetical protein VG205_10640 [Acidimicrobiales bacterium]|nr:hypothetical protein [Acidimicrobiales bacterium]